MDQKQSNTRWTNNISDQLIKSVSITQRPVNGFYCTNCEQFISSETTIPKVCNEYYQKLNKGEALERAKIYYDVDTLEEFDGRCDDYYMTVYGDDMYENVQCHNKIFVWKDFNSTYDRILDSYDAEYI